jgi:hypothetical protein
VTSVPDASKMSHDTFRKHLELRHLPEGDFSSLQAFTPGSHFAGNRPTFETYHDYLHRTFDYGHQHKQ